MSDSENSGKEVKQPTTFQEQIELYKRRELQIDNNEFTEDILKRINYYRLSGYSLSLKNDGVFKDGTSFNHLLSIYELDRKLKHLLLESLENIEIAFRTHIAYLIAHKYGPLGYKDKKIFLVEVRHKEFMDDLFVLFKKSRKNELFIEHHYKEYGGNIPIWVAVDVTSFVMISKLFNNMKDADKKEIAETYYNISYPYIKSWLQTLSYIRNICAHYGRLYDRKIAFRPKLFKGETDMDNKKCFAVFYIIKRLLSEQEADRFLSSLEALIDEYEDKVDISCYGMKDNWKEILNK